MEKGKNMNDQPESPKKSKRAVNRSAAYPSITLEDAVSYLRKLHEDLGKGPYDRHTAAATIGHETVSGPAAMKIASLVHYGLLERVGGGYQETVLGSSLAMPADEKEEEESLLEAFGSPKLFSQLVDEYSGNALPVKLDVMLVRNHRIGEKAAPRAASVFRQSAEYIGLLENGFLNARKTSGETTAEGAISEEGKTAHDGGTSHADVPVAIPNSVAHDLTSMPPIQIQIPLESGGFASLVMPKTIKAEEVSVIIATLKSITGLKDEEVGIQGPEA